MQNIINKNVFKECISLDELYAKYNYLGRQINLYEKEIQELREKIKNKKITDSNMSRLKDDIIKLEELETKMEKLHKQFINIEELTWMTSEKLGYFNENGEWKTECLK